MKGVRFIKAEGAGNDLILVDGRGQDLPYDEVELATRICERHFGVGGDGLLTLAASEDGLPMVRMFNPDGTEDFCGNGLCCVAAYLRWSGEATGERLVLRTAHGRHEAVVSPLGRRSFAVEVELVVPRFDPAAVPVQLHMKRVLEYPLEIRDSVWPVSCVSIGTAHTLIFSDADVEDRVFREISPLIERHSIFPDRTSVLWCRTESRNRIRMRIWERGVGETYACGTGTCAAVVIGRVLGRTGDRADVVTQGGKMSAEWDGSGPVRLTGPARIVYAGEWCPG